MFLFNFHTEPLPACEKYGECKGAYVAVFINYQDYDGAVELAKYYIESNDWKILQLEEEYWILESQDDVNQDNLEYYEEASQTGYSVIFNLYESDDEDE